MATNRSLAAAKKASQSKLNPEAAIFIMPTPPLSTTEIKSETKGTSAPSSSPSSFEETQKMILFFRDMGEFIDDQIEGIRDGNSLKQDAESKLKDFFNKALTYSGVKSTEHLIDTLTAQLLEKITTKNLPSYISYNPATAKSIFGWLSDLFLHRCGMHFQQLGGYLFDNCERFQVDLVIVPEVNAMSVSGFFFGRVHNNTTQSSASSTVNFGIS